MRQGIQSSFPHPKIAKEGCYFLCLLEAAERYLKSPDYFSNQDIENLYSYSVKRNWMDADCYVMMPGAVSNYVCQDFIYENTAYKTYVKPDRLWYINCNTKKSGDSILTHFTLSWNGDIWDPLDPDRPSKVGYKITSYRFLRYLDKRCGYAV